MSKSHYNYVTVIFIVLVALLCSCSRGNGTNNTGNGKVFTSLADFQGKKIASEYGGIFPQLIDRVIPNVDHKHYQSVEEVIAALQTGAVDAIVLDMPVALYLTAHNKGLAVFPYVISVDTYGFAVPKGSQLCEDGNRILRRLKDGGVIDEAEMYWFAADDGREKEMPKLTHKPDFDGAAGTIRFGCENTLFPMSYTTPDGKPMGFDIDIVYRIAYELNMKVEVITMHIGELLPALLTGRLDMAGGSMLITDERKKSVDFIGPYFEGGTALVVRKRNMPN